MAQAIVNIVEASRETLLQNEIDDYLRSLAAPRLVVTRDTDGSFILSQDTTYDPPKSVHAHPLAHEFPPGRNCNEVMTRRRWRWKVTLEWDRQVVTDRWIERVAHEGIQVTDGWRRLLDVESPYRPMLDPEKGTILILTLETLSR